MGLRLHTGKLVINVVIPADKANYSYEHTQRWLPREQAAVAGQAKGTHMRAKHR